MIEKFILDRVSFDAEVSINLFWYDFQRRWQKSQRKVERFLQHNSDWLEGYIIFSGPSTSSSNKMGRPAKKFDESCDRSKRRKTETLRRSKSSSELLFAAKMNLREEAKSCTNPKDDCIPAITSEQALAIFVDAKLTKRSYNLIRGPVKSIYPSYYRIQAEKSRCYPLKSSIICSEESCQVNLQALLDKTTSRLISRFEVKVRELTAKGQREFNLILKWGCDGSSGMSEYKQRFFNPHSNDSHVFLTAIVPLRFAAGDVVIWNNPRPSSTRYCRPISLQFRKETTDTIREEHERMIAEINNLTNSKYLLDGVELSIKYDLSMTMIDGKVVNAITNTSSAQRCYLCGATSASFNNLSGMKTRKIEDDWLQYGLSSLHCWIRVYECILHIAYRLKFKKWCKTGHEDEFNATKMRIQQEFREKLGLHVDKPRSSSGNSNDGNTARRFFANAETASDITKVDQNLIERLRTILTVISCCEEIDPEKFQIYAYETAQLYVDLYGWYRMPTSLHKILIHGHKIIDKAILPIGRMSEEAQEHMNKEIRRLRKDHSRKFSRVANLEDVFNGLIVLSDPIISQYRTDPERNQNLSEEVKRLLKKEEDDSE